MTVTALQIGLDPEVIDYSSPDFAQFPGLCKEKLRTANDDNVAAAECGDGGANTFVNVLHSRPLPPVRRQRVGGATGHDGVTPTWPR